MSEPNNTPKVTFQNIYNKIIDSTFEPVYRLDVVDPATGEPVVYLPIRYVLGYGVLLDIPCPTSGKLIKDKPLKPLVKYET